MFNSFIYKNFSTIFYFGYFILGKYLYEFIKKKNLKKYNILFSTIIFICFAISIILNYYFSHKYNMFYNKYFAYKSPFIIVSSILFFIIIVSNFNKEKLNKTLLFLSDISLGVYLIHGIFLDVVKKATNNMECSAFAIPLFSLIIFILSVFSVWLLRKNKIFKEIL